MIGGEQLRSRGMHEAAPVAHSVAVVLSLGIEGCTGICWNFHLCFFIFSWAGYDWRPILICHDRVSRSCNSWPLKIKGTRVTGSVGTWITPKQMLDEGVDHSGPWRKLDALWWMGSKILWGNGNLQRQRQGWSFKFQAVAVPFTNFEDRLVTSSLHGVAADNAGESVQLRNQSVLKTAILRKEKHFCMNKNMQERWLKWWTLQCGILPAQSSV